ncbi:hypothetical protein NKR74_14580 [Bacillus sp. 3103sda1]|uniref:hypothetical protein n=1 Tax=Bacillus sp. 3103sda1 TaxID=2953808 RepID=UPI0020A10D0B|nr:hypothetical protein [Bacillus sp. 3103sda1]MCP1124515.1 hypothetical protein [Bacillus sp. 3103sda1]
MENEILFTICKLQFATRRHLMAVHDMGGIRNVNRTLYDLLDRFFVMQDKF